LSAKETELRPAAAPTRPLAVKDRQRAKYISEADFGGKAIICYQ